MNQGYVYPFIVKLKNALPESIWPWVTAALCQDVAVWEQLQNPDFHQRVLAQELSVWTALSPGNLALLALELEMNELESGGERLPIDRLRAEIQHPINASLRKKAGRFYEAFNGQRSEKPPDRDDIDSEKLSSLAKAGLLALALRERRRLVGSWEGLGEEISGQAEKTGMAIYTSWRTPLACLYGMIPDSDQMLISLLTGNTTPERHRLAVHALVCNPLSPEEMAEQMLGLLRKLNLEEAVAFLHELSERNSALSTRLALCMKDAHQGEIIGKIENNYHRDPLEQASDIRQLLIINELHRLSNDSHHTEHCLQRAWESVQHLEASLASALATTSSNNGDNDQAIDLWQKAVSLVPDFPLYRARLTSSLLEAGHIDEARTWLPDEDYMASHGGRGHPEFLHAALACAHHAFRSGDPDGARKSALSAIEFIIVNHGAASSQTTLVAIQELAKLLLELGLPIEAAHAAEAVLAQRPNDSNVLALLGQARYAAGQAQEAVSAMQTATALVPHSQDMRRQLAGLLEAAGDWHMALQEWFSIVEGSSADPSGSPSNAHPSSQDLCALAKCALRAGEPESAINACQQALGMETEEGFSDDSAIAHLLLGEALEQLGDPQTAQQHFSTATQLVPHKAEAWLALAEVQKRTGQPLQALETLRAGVQSAPDAPGIYLALGEAYLFDWEERGHTAPTQALGMFQKAAQLITLDGGHMRHPDCASQVALRLGETLHQLGHNQEARKVLEAAYHANPSYPSLAYTFAQTLQALNETRAALPVLSHVLQSDDSNIPAYIDYASALLALNEQPEEAISAMKRVHELSPGHEQAQALLAEALSANGDLQNALLAYQGALETELVEDPGWCSRISLGLGRVALALKQPDIAIAALQEASLADPNNPQIPCSLAEAYHASGLLEDALQTARVALSLALEDLDILIWFAEKAVQWIGPNGLHSMSALSNTLSNDLVSQVRTEALNALARAIQLAPQRTDLLLRLGKIQLQMEDRNAALETFRNIVSAEKPTIDDLHHAARNLLILKDAPKAVAGLERAINLSGSSKGEAFGVEGSGGIGYTLVAAYQQAGNTQAALAALDAALSRDPHNITLSRTKANLLLELGRSQEALACLEEALNLHPESENAPDLHQRAAVILRAIGDLPAALTHTERILTAPNITPLDPQHLWARVLAADIALSMLQSDRARAFLGIPPTLKEEHDYNSLKDRKEYLEYFCLHAELALDKGDENTAADAFSIASDKINFNEISPDVKARLLALEARLAAFRGQHSLAVQRLKEALVYSEMHQQENAGIAGGSNGNSENESRQKAIDALLPENLTALSKSTHLNYHSLAEASLHLRQWENTLELLARAVENSPLEPLSHVGLARALVLRAEDQRLYQAINVINHAPGREALGEEAQQAFENAIKTANVLINKWVNEHSPSGNPALANPEAAISTISRWQARGQAVFQPSVESSIALASLPATHESPEDVAMFVAAVRETFQKEAANAGSKYPSNHRLIAKAVESARNYPLHPQVLVQLALTLEPELVHLEEAYCAATHALNNEIGEVDASQTQESCSDNPMAAIYKALIARLAYNSGDMVTAIESIQAALAFWPDEPYWHKLAGDIYIACGDLPSAIVHLEQAVELEPDHMQHYLELGQAYLLQAQSVAPGGAAEETKNAIQILEKACMLEPKKIEPWIALAHSHLAARGEDSLEQAAKCAEQAINLAPDKSQPLVLRSEIAMLAGDYQEAYDRALVASRLEELARFSGEEESPVPQIDPYPVLLLARALDGLGRTSEAITSLEKALPQARERLPLLLERLQLLSRSQGQEAALISLQELAQEFPDEPIVLSPLAKALASAGDKENAIHTAQRAIQAISSGQERHTTASSLDAGEQAELHYLLGQLLRENGQLDQSIYHLNEAIRQAPQSLEPYLELGRAYQDRRQHIQALQIYNQAMVVAPNESEPYYYAGLALKESKDYLGAESMLRRAVDLAPTNLSIHRQLGAVVALNLVHNRRK